MLYKYLLLFVLLLIEVTSFGQAYHKNQTISKSFAISNDTELKVKNKYGNIQLIPWEKDSVKFEVSIEVRDKKEEKAISIMKDIDVDFVSSKKFLESKTSFIGDGSFWTGVKDKTSNVFSSDNKIQINYEIYLPKWMTIHIENKYGDIYLDEHIGQASITLSNGDLKAYAFKGKTKLNLEFAYANIKQFDSGEIILGYHSELKLLKADIIMIQSRSSRVQIESVNKLELKSHRDKYLIDDINILNAVNTYSYLEIKNLVDFIDINAKYGDIDVKNLSSQVTNLYFDVENTNIHFIKPQQRTMEFELIYNERAGLYFPSELSGKKTIKENEKEKLVKTTGTLGDSNSNLIHVKAKMISGNIRVETK